MAENLCEPEVDIVNKVQAVDRVSSYFSRGEWVVFAAVILLGVFLRLYDLDGRPIHHDESIHIMYGVYFIDRPEELYYKYDPMLHGPFLYNFYRMIFSSFGVSLTSARAPIAILGSLFMFLPLLFSSYLSRRAVLGLTTACALSPMMIYWSRFIRHDFFVLSGLFLMLFGVLRARKEQKSLFVLIGITLQFCTKENAYVTSAVLLGYFVFEHFFDYSFLKQGKSIFRSICTDIREHRLQVLFALTLSVLMYVYFYTAGFRYFGEQGKGWFEQYFGVIYDGVFRKSIGYWFEHHSKERIKGPFLFHFYMLAWYELPFVIALFTHGVILLREAGDFVRRLIAAAIIFSLGLLLYNFSYPLEGGAFWNFFKLKNTYDLIGLLVLFTYPFVITVHHLCRDERKLAFWGYLFSALLFTYSYLGEKVPWLSIYPLVAGLIYLTVYFDDYFTRHPLGWYRRTSLESTLKYLGIGLLVLACVFITEEWFKLEGNRALLVIAMLCLLIAYLNHPLKVLGSYNLLNVLFIIFVLFNLRAAIQSNYVYAGAASEVMSQVHTTPEFHKIVRRVRDEISSRKKGYRLRVFADELPVWPMSAYMVGVPEYSYIVPKEGRGVFDYIFQDYKLPPKDIPEGYRTEKINFRGWWVPDYETMTLKKFLNYTIYHKPWNPVGYAYLFFSTKLVPVRKIEKQRQERVASPL